MSPVKRGDTLSAFEYVDKRWKGLPRIRLSTGTTSKKLAKAMENTLEMLRASGRRDILGLLASHRLSLPDVHATYLRNPADLDRLVAVVESPTLGVLVAEWLSALPSMTSRRGRPYTTATVARYASNWQGLFAALPSGQEATLLDLTEGFVASYRLSRKKAVGGRARYESDRRPSASTINRDLAALGAFQAWAVEIRSLSFKRLKLRHLREPAGREVWFNRAQLTAFERACSAEWWPLFATLFMSGLRLGEAKGLRVADVVLDLGTRHIDVNERERSLKTDSATRWAPLSDELASLLAEWVRTQGLRDADFLFGPELGSYPRMRREWNRCAAAAGLPHACPHDARHTFAVHAARGGVLLSSIQRFMGHSTPIMTMRYMKHDPALQLGADAAKIDASMRSVEAAVEVANSTDRLRLA